MGFSPGRILSELETSDPYPEYRQIGVLDRSGLGAASSGQKSNPWSGHVVGENFVAMGNSVVSEKVVSAMAAAFERDHDQELDEERQRADGNHDSPRTTPHTTSRSAAVRCT